MNKPIPNLPDQATQPPKLPWAHLILWTSVAVASFQADYLATNHVPAAGLLIFGYALGLIKIADQGSIRAAFYSGLAVGFCCCAPQLFFLWKIFNVAAIPLWFVFAFWIAAFTALLAASGKKWGRTTALCLSPFLWTGLEYFRSELYFLKFSWLNVGYVFPNFTIAPYLCFGMYGVGLLVFAFAAVISCIKSLKSWAIYWLGFSLLALTFLAFVLGALHAARGERPFRPLSITGVQLEFPPEGALPEALNSALKKHPDTQLFVLSEYTLESSIPETLKQWCRHNSRYLIVGGKDVVTNEVYFNSAFVVGTNGEVIFKQAKSVPIQFFHDGLPATNQEVWTSPWGKIGICICYDLSYTRVTDTLIKKGAQLLVVPTMDVEEWGTYEHGLHARIAPVRAAEYGIPIFRLASSGISQAVSGQGKVLSQTHFGSNDEILAASFNLPFSGMLPWDRWLAPFCVAVTVVTVAVLIFSGCHKKRP